MWVLKVPKSGNMLLVTGGIKTGKTTLAVRMAYKRLRMQRIKVWFYNNFGRYWKSIGKRKLQEPKPRPELYSNIPLNTPYIPLTTSLLNRTERFIYGSVVYICESSLVADSMSFKDPELNERLLLFNKLFAHETRGGYLIYDTQSINDNHYAVKRCLSTYIWIQKMLKFPFFCLMFVRELKFSDDNSTVNTFDQDVEKNLQWVIVPKSTWKLFDCYCYSILTDHLPVVEEVVKKADSLKADEIISFKTFFTIPKKKEAKT